MIMPAANRLRLIGNSGELRPFCGKELCLNLLRSFLASGLREESWVAEDLALAVEYTLEHGSRESGVYSESELNSMVIKVLEQTGYPEVAARFSSDANVAIVKCFPEPETLKPILRRHLAVQPETADLLAGKTAAACHAMGLKTITPALAVELAKALHDKQEQIMPEPARTTRVRGNTPWLISAEKLIANLPEISHNMIDNGILCVYGVSRMFPSLRVKCSLDEIALELRLEPPITEMMLFPALNRAAEAIDGIVLTAERLSQNESLPLVLEMDRPNDFAENWLDIFGKTGIEAIAPLTQSLAEMLRHPPFKII